MAKIIHIDMDCFYAAVELKRRPELRGRPVAVGGTPEGRGVIATASYEARRYGVRSAMSAAKALRLCPELVLLPCHFDLYRAESRHIQGIFARFTNLIEPLSLDEAYLDVTDSPHFEGSATLIAREIRRLIFEETRLTASAGVAPNKMLAKVASEWNKPNGMKVIRPEDVMGIMPLLPVEKINGVGRVTAAKMHEMGLKTCGDLQKLTLLELTKRFGSWGAKLYEYSRGIDERAVDTSRDRKSLSVENTFSRDLQTLEDCLAEIPELYSDWRSRLERKELDSLIRGIFVKLKFHDFVSTTHECVMDRMPEPEDFERLLRQAWERGRRPVRLIGVGVRLTTPEEAEADRRQLKLPLENGENLPG